MADEVLYEVNDHVATITLNRPERRNAATFDMGEQLMSAFADVEGDDVEAAWGDPRMADIVKGLGGIRPPLTPESQTVLGCTKPTIAAVNGVAVGIGMDFAVMCDLRVASEYARFGLFYVKMGLMAD